MRAADRHEQQRIDATLDHIATQLDQATVPDKIRDAVIDEAERILHLRPAASPLGWLITWDDLDTRHTHIPDLALAFTQSAGRLGFIIDLEHAWHTGAGHHGLLEAHERTIAHRQRRPHTDPQGHR